MTRLVGSKSGLSVSVLLLSGVFGAVALSQSTAATTPTDAPPPAKSMNVNDNGTYATGKPLEQQSKEGFWGHLNPLARKKWVKRQVDPIKDRTNELDQLQAKNANDIHDVDTRSQAGISKAMSAANTADQHALDAGNRANAANTLAGSASTRTDALRGTVSSLDSFNEVRTSTVAFPVGRTALGPKAKTELDELAEQFGTEKGYIVEVQGYSRAGVQSSQAMADSVVRYLVTQHQVPLYRIYKTGLGKQKDLASEAGQKALTNGVRVTLLHNSLASLDKGTTASRTSVGTSNPPSEQ